MPRFHFHYERHQMSRIGWMRAAVLGANDGIVSTASLIIGVAAASSGKGEIAVAGVAALVAGAMSMAAGEYVSVSSQSDAEQAELAKERQELIDLPEAELAELAGIYEERGLKPETAKEVASQMTADDPLRAHARDELGITDMTAAKPVQAAISSAISFAIGAALPLALVWIVPLGVLVPVEAAASLVFLALLGVVGAKAGGASIWRPTLRVTFWGALAMALTAGIGHLVGGVI
ncbi:MAG: membrane protein [Hyphomonas sp. BRH_c22]|uniref:VIT1/CCC1 transporter family protein n=1 Tax=Hyphomonas sp. BRH_c22 TaxID=1629710 RepID=UPI0005F10D0D|nr:MAG: membrane protein [Hyphomonas sp. BRH_c22]